MKYLYAFKAVGVVGGMIYLLQDRPEFRFMLWLHVAVFVPAMVYTFYQIAKEERAEKEEL